MSVGSAFWGFTMRKIAPSTSVSLYHIQACSGILFRTSVRLQHPLSIPRPPTATGFCHRRIQKKTQYRRSHAVFVLFASSRLCVTPSSCVRRKDAKTLTSFNVTALLLQYCEKHFCIFPCSSVAVNCRWS